MSNGARAFLGSGMALLTCTGQDPTKPPNNSPCTQLGVKQGQVIMYMGVNGAGEIPMSSYDDHVRQSILLILSTATGERVMRPNFGGGLQAMVFSPINSATTAMVQNAVTNALTNFEPRIDVLNVQVTTDSSQPGLLQIDLQYRVRQTDTMFNLVYPFFLERGAY